LKLLRFIAVGGFCFLLNLAVLYVGTDVIGLHYLVSMLASVAITTAASWLLNRIYTFKSKDPAKAREAGRFLRTTLMNMAIATLAMFIAVDFIGLNYLVSSALIAIVMTAWNFFAHNRWSFLKQHQGN
jgi:putative flippase GtrA